MSSVLKLRFPFLVLLLVLAATLLLTGRAAAQSASEAAKIAANLQPESRAVLDRLSGLHELPDGAWKLHAGDLAHGEAVNLDESGWEAIAVGSRAPNEAVWFRQAFQVPDTLRGYDLTGARIWFQFHADANGPMPQILYFNGRRVAMGDDLEPVVLFDDAKPGEKVVVAVKLLHTVDTKRFRGATLKIDFPENRPNPEDLRLEFLSAALLVPSLAPGDAAQMATLNASIRAVDLAALDAHDQARFDTSLKAAHGSLEALKPLLQQATLHLTGNSHIDAAWLWPWTETVDVVKRTFGTALQLMHEYPQYTYTQSAAAYNEWIAQKYPDMNAEIAQRIKEGRWEIVGGMWVEPDLNMPDGESLVRQFLVGKRWYKQAYGVDVRIGWNPDSFGYTWQLPQIYEEERRGLLCHPEDGLERHQSTSLQVLLVAVAGWLEGALLLSPRLRQRQSEPCAPGARFHHRAEAGHRAAGHHGPLRHRRPRRRTHARHSGRGFSLGRAGTCDAEDRVRHGAELFLWRSKSRSRRTARPGITAPSPRATRLLRRWRAR